MPSTRVALIASALSALFLPVRALGETGILKGPWLMEPRDTSITVMVERVAPGPVTVRVWSLAPWAPAQSPDGGVASAGPMVFRDRTDVTLHEVRVSGLQAGRRYHYEVTGPDLEAASGNFVTAPDTPEPFRFVLYGDTRSNSATHAAIASAIVREAPDFVIHTGDFVSDGRREGLWQRFFEIEHQLLRNTPLIPVIGNHEIQRGQGIDTFRRYVHVDADSPEPELDYMFSYGNVRIIVVNAYGDWNEQRHHDWLERELTRARAEVPTGFLMVAMHWGPRSSGPHGENHRTRMTGIDDLFRRNHVDLVLSGHDHIYERGDDEGLRYIVSGGGGAELYSHTHPHAYTRAFASEHHYVRADVESDHIDFTAVRLDGSVIDHCTLRRSGWDCGEPTTPTPVAVPAPHPGRVAARRVGHPTWRARLSRHRRRVEFALLVALLGVIAIAAGTRRERR